MTSRGMAVIFLLGLIAGGAAVWWWSTREPESFGQANDAVRRVATDVGKQANSSSNLILPTQPPVIVPPASPAPAKAVRGLADQTASPTFVPTPTPIGRPAPTPEAVIVPVTLPTVASVAAPTTSPTPVPTPAPAETPVHMLSPLEIMRLVDRGKLTEEEAVAILAQRNKLSKEKMLLIPTATPKTAALEQRKPAPEVAPPTPRIIPPPVSPPPANRASPAQRHLEEKKYMLTLINSERTKAGLGQVVLGDNIAAQLHAESSLANCFSSHWGMDGLKPYMRYSLAGGYQSNGENGHGSDYCIKASDGYRAIQSIREEIREAMIGWMNSPGHRRNILDPTHKKINIGMAWDRYNVKMYQHFEGDYVGYTNPPRIDNGILTFSGSVKNGAGFGNLRDLGVQIYYDKPPIPLTLGQVSRTYCYGSGLNVAGLRQRLTDGSYWTTHRFNKTYSPCPDPADVPADAPPARSPSEAHRLWREAYERSKSKTQVSVTVPWIDAEKFSVNRNGFTVRVNIRDALSKHGDGVYSIMVWGRINSENALISQYSIFHGVTPPGTYDAGR